MRRFVAALVATVVLSGAAVVGLSGSPSSWGATVIPTQWVMKQFTELLGRTPTGSEWNSQMGYYQNAPACNKSTLATLGKATAESSEFLNDYPESTDKAARVLALVRAVYHHDPNSSDWSGYYTPYRNGSETWNQVVDSIFASFVFAANNVPSLCDAGNPSYGFIGGLVPDLLAWSGAGVSRTQAQLQQALNAAAPNCTTVSLQRTEVVRIGGTQPTGDPQNTPLQIPACVTLTTTGNPTATGYATMGRLVSKGSICDAPTSTCDHIEMVQLGDGASLSNVWVDGNGLQSGSRIGLVGTASGQTPVQVDDDRLSDPPADGTAVRVTGYGTTGVDCANRDISRNLVTGYVSQHAQTRLGAALWVDGISVFCEQATVQGNNLADISGDGIDVFGIWNAETEQLRTQHSTVSGNHVVSAGNSAAVAFGLDGTGECDATSGGLPAACIQMSDNRQSENQTPQVSLTAERSFVGTSVSGNTFWTGPRTTFDIGLMVGGKTRWGDNGPYARGASVTDNTVDGVTGTQVNAGIAVSGMLRATLIGNTPTYSLVDTQPTVDPAGKCQQGNVWYGWYVGTLTTDSQPATGISTGNYQCLAPPPPAGGLENIGVGTNQTTGSPALVGASSHQPFTPWGQNYSGDDPSGDTDTIPLNHLREMKEMGANVIRLRLQFRTFMTDDDTSVPPTCIPIPSALARLAQTVHEAEQNAMYLDLTGLASYAGDAADPSCYGQATTDAQRWDAQAAFWSAIAGTVANSPAVLVLDLANEPSIPTKDCRTSGWANCPGVDPTTGIYWNQVITQYLGSRTKDEVATDWISQMTAAISTAEKNAEPPGGTPPPPHLTTIGCLGFPNCGGFQPITIAPLLDYMSVHIYPQDCTGPAPTPPNPDPCAPFNERAIEQQTGDPLALEKTFMQPYSAQGKPVVVEETAGPKNLERNFILQSRQYTTYSGFTGSTAGWIGNWTDGTPISQRLASGDLLYANWGRLFQDITHIIAPCGTCEP